MTIPPPPRIDVADLGSTWSDDVADLTDRRRLLLRSVLGVDLSPTLVGIVFSTRPGCAGHALVSAVPSASSSWSTTRRSDGRSSSTDDR